MFFTFWVSAVVSLRVYQFIRDQIAPFVQPVYTPEDYFFLFWVYLFSCYICICIQGFLYTAYWKWRPIFKGTKTVILRSGISFFGKKEAKFSTPTRDCLSNSFHATLGFRGSRFFISAKTQRPCSYFFQKFLVGPQFNFWDQKLPIFWLAASAKIANHRTFFRVPAFSIFSYSPAALPFHAVLFSYR
jgi:hypothetical protein